MLFWTRLDNEMTGSRGDSVVNDPDAVEHKLDRIGIRNDLNRQAAQSMLDFIAAGRAKAAAERSRATK